LAQQPGNAPPEKVRELILRALRRYPKMNISMLTPVVRPYQRNWKVTLEEMIKDGTVLRKSDLTGARLVFTYCLPAEADNVSDVTDNEQEAVVAA